MHRLRPRTCLPGASLTLVAALLCSAPAQRSPAAEPSPLAPGDLKRPIFDTRTPTYGTTGQQAKGARTVVAEVDGRPVTLGDVGDAVADLPATVRALPLADLFPTIVAQLVRQQALVVRAQREGLDEDPVVRRKAKAAADRVVANAVLEQDAARAITEAALLARYGRDVAGKPGAEEVHLRVIMTATEAAAAAIIAELRAGGDFAALARRASQDSTAPAGGDAGFAVRDGLTPEIGAVAFSLPPGQVTAFPVRSAGGWFVLKVEERRRQPAPPFGLARESLRQAMLREGAAEIVTAAMADVTVREFDINGAETAESAADAGARTPK